MHNSLTVSPVKRSTATAYSSAASSTVKPPLASTSSVNYLTSSGGGVAPMPRRNSSLISGLGGAGSSVSASDLASAVAVVDTVARIEHIERRLLQCREHVKRASTSGTAMEEESFVKSFENNNASSLTRDRLGGGGGGIGGRSASSASYAGGGTMSGASSSAASSTSAAAAAALYSNNAALPARHHHHPHHTTRDNNTVQFQGDGNAPAAGGDKIVLSRLEGIVSRLERAAAAASSSSFNPANAPSATAAAGLSSSPHYRSGTYNINHHQAESGDDDLLTTEKWKRKHRNDDGRRSSSAFSSPPHHRHRYSDPADHVFIYGGADAIGSPQSENRMNATPSSSTAPTQQRQSLSAGEAAAWRHYERFGDLLLQQSFTAKGAMLLDDTASTVMMEGEDEERRKNKGANRRSKSSHRVSDGSRHRVYDEAEGKRSKSRHSKSENHHSTRTKRKDARGKKQRGGRSLSSSSSVSPSSSSPSAMTSSTANVTVSRSVSLSTVMSASTDPSVVVGQRGSRHRHQSHDTRKEKGKEDHEDADSKLRKSHAHNHNNIKPAKENGREEKKSRSKRADNDWSSSPTTATPTTKSSMSSASPPSVVQTRLNKVLNDQKGLLHRLERQSPELQLLIALETERLRNFKKRGVGGGREGDLKDDNGVGHRSKPQSKTTSPLRRPQTHHQGTDNRDEYQSTSTPSRTSGAGPDPDSPSVMAAKRALGLHPTALSSSANDDSLSAAAAPLLEGRARNTSPQQANRREQAVNTSLDDYPPSRARRESDTNNSHRHNDNDSRRPYNSEDEQRKLVAIAARLSNVEATIEERAAWVARLEAESEARAQRDHKTISELLKTQAEQQKRFELFLHSYRRGGEGRSGDGRKGGTHSDDNDDDSVAEALWSTASNQGSPSAAAVSRASLPPAAQNKTEAKSTTRHEKTSKRKSSKKSDTDKSNSDNDDSTSDFNDIRSRSGSSSSNEDKRRKQRRRNDNDRNHRNKRAERKPTQDDAFASSPSTPTPAAASGFVDVAPAAAANALRSSSNSNSNSYSSLLAQSQQLVMEQHRLLLQEQKEARERQRAEMAEERAREREEREREAIRRREMRREEEERRRQEEEEKLQRQKAEREEEQRGQRHKQDEQQQQQREAAAASVAVPHGLNTTLAPPPSQHHRTSAASLSSASALNRTDAVNSTAFLSPEEIERSIAAVVSKTIKTELQSAMLAASSASLPSSVQPPLSPAAAVGMSMTSMATTTTTVQAREADILERLLQEKEARLRLEEEHHHRRRQQLEALEDERFQSQQREINRLREQREAFLQQQLEQKQSIEKDLAEHLKREVSSSAQLLSQSAAALQNAQAQQQHQQQTRSQFRPLSASSSNGIDGGGGGGGGVGGGLFSTLVSRSVSEEQRLHNLRDANGTMSPATANTTMATSTATAADIAERERHLHSLRNVVTDLQQTAEMVKSNTARALADAELTMKRRILDEKLDADVLAKQREQSALDAHLTEQRRRYEAELSAVIALQKEQRRALDEALSRNDRQRRDDDERRRLHEAREAELLALLRVERERAERLNHCANRIDAQTQHNGIIAINASHIDNSHNKSRISQNNDNDSPSRRSKKGGPPDQSLRQLVKTVVKKDTEEESRGVIASSEEGSRARRHSQPPDASLINVSNNNVIAGRQQAGLNADAFSLPAPPPPTQYPMMNSSAAVAGGGSRSQSPTRQSGSGVKGFGGASSSSAASSISFVLDPSVIVAPSSANHTPPSAALVPPPRPTDKTATSVSNNATGPRLFDIINTSNNVGSNATASSSAAAARYFTEANASTANVYYSERENTLKAQLEEMRRLNAAYEDRLMKERREKILLASSSSSSLNTYSSVDARTGAESRVVSPRRHQRQEHREDVNHVAASSSSSPTKMRLGKRVSISEGPADLRYVRETHDDGGNDVESSSTLRANADASMNRPSSSSSAGRRRPTSPREGSSPSRKSRDENGSFGHARDGGKKDDGKDGDTSLVDMSASRDTKAAMNWVAQCSRNPLIVGKRNAASTAASSAANSNSSATMPQQQTKARQARDSSRLSSNASSRNNSANNKKDSDGSRRTPSENVANVSASRGSSSISHKVKKANGGGEDQHQPSSVVNHSRAFRCGSPQTRVGGGVGAAGAKERAKYEEEQQQVRRQQTFVNGDPMSQEVMRSRSNTSSPYRGDNYNPHRTNSDNVTPKRSPHHNRSSPSNTNNRNRGDGSVVMGESYHRHVIADNISEQLVNEYKEQHGIADNGQEGEESSSRAPPMPPRLSSPTRSLRASNNLLHHLTDDNDAAPMSVMRAPLQQQERRDVSPIRGNTNNSDHLDAATRSKHFTNTSNNDRSSLSAVLDPELYAYLKHPSHNNNQNFSGSSAATLPRRSPQKVSPAKAKNTGNKSGVTTDVAAAESIVMDSSSLSTTHQNQQRALPNQSVSYSSASEQQLSTFASAAIASVPSYQQPTTAFLEHSSLKYQVEYLAINKIAQIEKAAAEKKAREAEEALQKERERRQWMVGGASVSAVTATRHGLGGLGNVERAVSPPRPGSPTDQRYAGFSTAYGRTATTTATAPSRFDVNREDRRPMSPPQQGRNEQQQRQSFSHASSSFSPSPRRGRKEGGYDGVTKSPHQFRLCEDPVCGQLGLR